MSKRRGGKRCPGTRVRDAKDLLPIMIGGKSFAVGCGGMCGLRPMENAKNAQIDSKRPETKRFQVLKVVEISGIEPLTS